MLEKGAKFNTSSQCRVEHGRDETGDIRSMSSSDKNTRAFDDLEAAPQCWREVAEAEYALADDALEAAEAVAKKASVRIAQLLIASPETPPARATKNNQVVACEE